MSEACNSCIDIQDIKEKVDKHEDAISELKADGREYKIEIKNLIKKMDDFMITIRWGLGIFVTVSIFVIGLLLRK